ncbi:YncE family protein, partial [candidate division WOR-3 bacterium]|nr:YncE family protein [candidate division WOR-3 bacterium]
MLPVVVRRSLVRTTSSHNWAVRPLAVLLAVCCCLSAAGGQWLETTIRFGYGSSPRALCYNTRDNKVYCVLSDSDQVAVIDGATNLVLATASTGDRPQGLCYNPADDKVYCANAGSDNVTVIDGASDEVIATVAAGDGPQTLCHNSVDNKVYVGNMASYDVTVIDGATNAVVATVAAVTARFMCYNPHDNKVYCTDGKLSFSALKVIDGKQDSVLACIDSMIWPGPLCYNPQANKVYCGDYYGCNVMVIDGTTDDVIAIDSAGVFS